MCVMSAGQHGTERFSKGADLRGLVDGEGAAASDDSVVLFVSVAVFDAVFDCLGGLTSVRSAQR